jgi:nitroreductase
MNTLKAIQERRSIKHFDPSHTMSEAEINTLMEHTLLSPTSFNMQNWRFVLVTDKGQKAKIKEAAWGQSQVEDASLTIVLCADLKAHEQADRYWANAPRETQEMIIPMIHKFYHDKAQLQNDEALRSIGIAGQTIMLAAKSMGYDSCPMIGFDPIKVAEIIQLPDNHIIGMIIPVGKALKPASPRSGPMPIGEICFNQHF